jgi:hypothetical protein
MLRLAAIFLILVFVSGSTVHGGANIEHKVAVHVLAHQARTCSKAFPAISSCEDIITTYAGQGDIDVFPVFYELTGVTGIEYGLMWPEEWGTCVYTKCAGEFSIGEIVNPGDGVAQTWSECQEVSVVVAGFGWLAAADSGKVYIVPKPGGGIIGAVDCAYIEDAPIDTVAAGIGGASGDDPCETFLDRGANNWGEIKDLFD